MPKKIDPTKADWSKQLALTVGRNLRLARTEKGLSAEELSEQIKAQTSLDISRNIIANIETGRREITTVQELHAFSTALGVSVGDLMEEDDASYTLDSLLLRMKKFSENRDKLHHEIIAFLSANFGLRQDIKFHENKGLREQLTDYQRGQFRALTSRGITMLESYKDGQKLLDESYKDFELSHGLVPGQKEKAAKLLERIREQDNAQGD